MRPGEIATAAEGRYMGRVASLCCVLCRFRFGITDSPALVHHVRTGTGKMRASHYDTIPLCPRHHDAYPGSLHVLGVKQFPTTYGISEIDLLLSVHRVLAEDLPPGHEAPPDPYSVNPHWELVLEEDEPDLTDF